MIRSKLVGSIALGILVLSVAGSAAAQGFETGKYYAGPRIWLGNLNGAVAFGAGIEKGFTKPGEYGPGIIAAGLGIDWYSWSFDYQPFGKWDYTVVPVQIFGNYHFPIKQNPKLDPYVGLALVYQHYGASWKEGTLSNPSQGASGSTTDFAGDAGLRYFISPTFALQGQIGFGYGTLGLGVNWAF